MPYLAVDKNLTESIYDEKPVRDKELNIWKNPLMVVSLPKG